MLKDVVKVEYLDDYRLHLRFEDGVEGVINVSDLVKFTGVFAPLEDKAYFAQVRVNPDIGTICWPNAADLDPDVLYAAITGEPIDISEPVGVSRQWTLFPPSYGRPDGHPPCRQSRTAQVCSTTHNGV